MPDINTLLMKTTFKIQSGDSLGSAFVLGQPVTNKAGLYSYVLITAAHVLDSMPGENATLFLRTFDGTNYQKLPHQLQIRSNSAPLYVRHAQADVVALRAFLPVRSDLDLAGISTDLLADDKFFEDFQIHPGDEIRVLGYPFGVESHASGFPVLRSGHIASFPLLPTTQTKTFLVDLQTFRGTSGGPVFIQSDRRLQSGAINTVTVQFLLGLVSQEISHQEMITGLDQQSVRQHKLGLGVVVHARFIKEVIAQLPPANF